MSNRAQTQELLALLVAALAVVMTLAIALGMPKSLEFQAMSGEVFSDLHGLYFSPDNAQAFLDGIPSEEALTLYGGGIALCSDDWTKASGGKIRWGLKMHWRFEGAKITQSSGNANLTCSVKVRRITQVRIIG